MLHIDSIQNGEDFFKALSAPARRKILEILYEEGDKNLNDLAKLLNLTNSAISLHIEKLEKAGLIEIHTTAGKRGTMKICKPKHEKVIIDLAPNREGRSYYEHDIEIGYYSDCKITPTCGIATTDQIIGEFDDPRYFYFPEHFTAGVLWFTTGYVEYTLPNHLISGQTLTELQLSFELSSECPGYNEDFPSDIHFYINDICIGYWVSPGDFGARQGRFTPAWWPRVCNQYGLLKTLVINERGSFIDGGNQIGKVTIHDLNIDYNSRMVLRFAVPDHAVNKGGFTIFGNGFGDYAQGIKMKAFYETNK